MKKPSIPNNEIERLKSVENYQILDTLQEDDFDNITKLASQICKTPISLITILDPERNWFKSHFGTDITESPREISFCAHAILTPNNPMVVSDTRIDKRFFDNPIVTGETQIHFYAGVPLVNEEGYALGTLCVMDHEKRYLGKEETASLKILANQVIRLFELRKKNILLNKLKNETEEQYKELEKFSYVVSHDIKSPLSNISALVKMLKNEHSDNLNNSGIEIIDYLSNASDRLKSLVDGILNYYRGDKLVKDKKELLDISQLLKSMRELLDPKKHVQFNFPEENFKLKINKIAFDQIMLNLITNAIKYNDKDKPKITIEVSEIKNMYHFKVIDNGPGISKNDQEGIFNLFKTLGQKDNRGDLGSGIGLATVKKLIEAQGGQITVESELKKGATFSFTLAK